MRWFGSSAVLVLTLSLAFSQTAWAATNEAKDRAARTACLSGNVQKGVDILSYLYVGTKNPIYLYNQGRCFEQNGRYEEAIPRFREYLLKANNASEGEKTDAEKHIAACQAAMAQKLAPEKEVAVAPSAPPPLPPPAPSPPPAEVTPPPSNQLVTNPAPQTQPEGRGLRIAGIVCGAVGVASIAAAVYFYSRARSLSDTVSKQPVPNPSDVSAGENAETMQWVFYGVGGAALATGVVLYAVGWRTADSRTTVGIAPFIGSGMTGIGAQGAF